MTDAEKNLDAAIATHKLEARGKRTPEEWAETADGGGNEMVRAGYRYAIKQHDAAGVAFALGVAAKRLRGETVE